MGENGTHHLQGYIEMSKPVRFSHFNMPGAHFEAARGTPEECIEYCSKNETRVGGPYRFGKQPSSTKQGSRTDIITLRDSIKSGSSILELFNSDSTVAPTVRYLRSVDRMVELYQPPKPRLDVRVIFHYGPAGTGKSHCAHEDGAYYYDGNNGFWNGYKGESTIILDEFGGHCLTPLMFQRLCDKYPFMVNVKGGCVPCNGSLIHITSNYLPAQWWSEKTRYNSEAIYRRIHVVHWHRIRGAYRMYESDENEYAMNKFLKDTYVNNQ